MITVHRFCGITTLVVILATALTLWFSTSVPAGAAGSDATQMGGCLSSTSYGPQEWVTGEPTLSVSYPQFQHPDTVFTSTVQTDQQWVYQPCLSRRARRLRR